MCQCCGEHLWNAHVYFCRQSLKLLLESGGHVEISRLLLKKQNKTEKQPDFNPTRGKKQVWVLFRTFLHLSNWPTRTPPPPSLVPRRSSHECSFQKWLTITCFSRHRGQRYTYIFVKQFSSLNWGEAEWALPTPLAGYTQLIHSTFRQQRRLYIKAT